MSQEKKQIKVLVVDDSAVAREILRYLIDSDPQLKVIGLAKNGEEALEFVKKESPDVITIDMIMPKMDGFMTTKSIMQYKAIPIIIVTSSYHPDVVTRSFKTLEAGAMALLQKPEGLYSANYQKLAKLITDTIKIVSNVRHPKQPKIAPPEIMPTIPSEEKAVKDIHAVAIGASLGGPQALNQILSHLPAQFPVPIFIVQHISQGFVKGLVDWLQLHTTLKIEIATNNTIALPGHVYVAPDSVHMEIKKEGVISLVDDEETHGVKPSVGRLFRSMAANFGPHCIGIILTGMGKDGAAEMLLMRQKGSYTIAQDQISSLLYGMPREAIELGAVRAVIPVEDIPTTLKRLLHC